MVNMASNPYAIGFGIKPLNYIMQTGLIDEIVDEFCADYIQHPCYMLSGVRGAGKTVAMLSIGEKLATYDNWIVVRLNPESELLEELAAKLYDTNSFWSDFINKEVNLSKFNIGVSIESVALAASIESALEKILRHLKKQEKRLLVEIDEVSNTKAVRTFAHSFQTFIGENLPIFLIMTGLHKNIKNLQDEANCTFLYRAEEVTLQPLNRTLIQESYVKTLGIDREKAWELASMTKGYPVAYQLFGKYMWESDTKAIDEEYLEHVDMALERYVYRKLWSELSDKDKWFLTFLCRKEQMAVGELLELSSQKKNEFSQYRVRLIEKGILGSPKRGMIVWSLPRFADFVSRRLEDV